MRINIFVIMIVLEIVKEFLVWLEILFLIEETEGKRKTGEWEFKMRERTDEDLSV